MKGLTRRDTLPVLWALDDGQAIERSGRTVVLTSYTRTSTGGETYGQRIRASILTHFMREGLVAKVGTFADADGDFDVYGLTEHGRREAAI